MGVVFGVTLNDLQQALTGREKGAWQDSIMAARPSSRA